MFPVAGRSVTRGLPALPLAVRAGRRPGQARGIWNAVRWEERSKVRVMGRAKVAERRRGEGGMAAASPGRVRPRGQEGAPYLCSRAGSLSAGQLSGEARVSLLESYLNLRAYQAGGIRGAGLSCVRQRGAAPALASRVAVRCQPLLRLP